ncbi:MAG: hypothetical protein ACO3ZY_02795 [Phycisphaerales bacterium]
MNASTQPLSGRRILIVDDDPDILERLQTLEHRPPVVMVTANQGKRHQQFAGSLGVEAYLVKPVPLGRLLEVAISLIEHRRD